MPLCILTSSSIQRILVKATSVALFFSLVACTSLPQRQAGFLMDYSILEPSSYDNILIYRALDFDPHEYNKIQIEPSIMYVAPKQLVDLTPEIQQEILGYVDAQLEKRVRVQSSANLLGKRELRVRAAISEIVTPNRALNVISSLLIGPITRGSASLEVEVTDASNGQLLMAATCSERGHVIADIMAAYSLLGHARIAINECMQRFEKAFHQAAAKN